MFTHPYIKCHIINISMLYYEKKNFRYHTLQLNHCACVIYTITHFHEIAKHRFSMRKNTLKIHSQKQFYRTYKIIMKVEICLLKCYIKCCVFKNLVDTSFVQLLNSITMNYIRLVF